MKQHKLGTAELEALRRENNDKACNEEKVMECKPIIQIYSYFILYSIDLKLYEM